MQYAIRNGNIQDTNLLKTIYLIDKNLVHPVEIFFQLENSLISSVF